MDDLTTHQCADLYQTVQALRVELQELLDGSVESSKAVDLDQPIGRLSRMDALQQQAMAKANREAHQRRLKLVEAALLMIKQERYGDCRRCEEPIGYPRLMARPETPFCLHCQQQIEGGA